MAYLKGEKELRLVRRASVLPAFTFSPAQLEVINHRRTPLTVYGGPGTGKTTTLVESVIARVSAGVDPNSILIITYGRERAADLRDQIALRAGSTSFEPLARTFHSLAFSILNEKLGQDPLRYVLISGAEQDAAIKAMVQNPLVNVPWHPDLQQALTTRGFVREVRDLILRATELGLNAKDLQAKGAELKEKYWDGVAHFWSHYYFSSELQSATVGDGLVRIDPSAIIHEALMLLDSDAKRLDLYRARYTTVIVDEFQESDQSQRALLKLLAPDDLLIFADPDSAIGRFRGADPDGLVRALDAMAPKKIVLGEVFRSSPEITDVVMEVSSHFKGTSPARLRKSVVNKEPGSVDLAKLSGVSEEANYIAHAFKSAHLRTGLPWSQMAVLVRAPGKEVSALQRAFTLNGIPLSVDATALALADNPAVTPLLALAQVVIRVNKGAKLTASDWPTLEEILLSEYGGADALQLRQIRLALSKVRDDKRSTTEMMIDALVQPTAQLPWEQILPLKRVNDLIAAGKKAAHFSSDVGDLIWALWDCAKDYEGNPLANVWRQRALAGGSKGAQADRDLDAVIQLFESARRFTERNVDSTPQLFIDQLLDERILSDSITSSAQREEVVSLLTVHAAKGLEWELVAVAGLQEGSWPNLKERGSLLGSDRLVEAARTGLTTHSEIRAASAAGLLEDERRLLHVALSRAKSRLIVTAVAEEDSAPSRYFEELCESVHGFGSDELTSSVPRSLTSQALVATLRREVMRGDEFAAGLLKTLADGGIKSADPDQWLGAKQLSVDAPVVGADQKVYVSPSSLASFDDCGLKWFLEKSGAQDGDSTAQLLGVAIHFIASQVAKNPDLSAQEGIAQLTDAWPVVDQNVGWYKKEQLEVASEMIRRFFEWNEKNPRELAFVEKSFTAELGRAVLSGSLDRLEVDENGKYFVVDLKTGGTFDTQEDVRSNKQLSAYQLAVTEGAIEGVDAGSKTAGAGLLYLAKTTTKNETVDQGAIIPDGIKEEIKATAEGMAAATFKAVINKRCRTCALKGICPLQTQGRSVIE